MATTVYSGSGAITHTNSSGGNQRILIYWLKTLNGSATMTIGNMSVNMSENQVFGLKLAINTYVNNNSSMTNTMTVTGGDGTGNRAVHGNSNVINMMSRMAMIIMTATLTIMVIVIEW